MVAYMGPRLYSWHTIVGNEIGRSRTRDSIPVEIRRVCGLVHFTPDVVDQVSSTSCAIVSSESEGVVAHIQSDDVRSVANPGGLWGYTPPPQS
ncbi:hypothetical protein AVEN_20394-1 [Araneus ventricosus]|uniref:Uncharacterized protein n=1 Tax=Araneus ventricosus TaxID=182803 RepID=A0A4Y2SJ51_ARAVE|nr:hypothetical protein AVEN_20394-1 [Araneus ventricosus]